MATAKPSPEATPAEDPKPLVLTNVRPSLVQIAKLTFKPGETHTIPPHYAAAVRKSPLFGRVLVEGKPTMPAPVEIAKPVTLAEQDEVKALAYIGIESDLAQLAQWATAESAGEKRKVVLDAISTRAASLGDSK